MREVLVGGVYHHFKGRDYEVVNIGTHSETQEKMVIYKNLDTNEIWIRPYEMFNSLVDKEKYPNIKQKFRFELK